MKSSQRILLIQLRAIGDVILTTPALRVLRKHFPQTEIDFVTNPAPAELLTNNPNINDVIVYPFRANDILGALKFSLNLKKNHYNIVLDFLGTPATALMSLLSGAPTRIGYDLRFRKFAYTHLEQEYRGDIYNALTKFSLLKPLGISEQEYKTEIFVADEERDWAEGLFRQKGWMNESVVAVAPFAKRLTRRWLPERFAEVARWLQQKGQQVVFLWGPGEREYVEEVRRQVDSLAVLSPPTSLMQVAALLQRCCLLVCNCGGTKHIAVAVNTPTLTIHGPTDPRVWAPPDDSRHSYVRADDARLENVSSQIVLEAIEAMGVLS